MTQQLSAIADRDRAQRAVRAQVDRLIAIRDGRADINTVIALRDARKPTLDAALRLIWWSVHHPTLFQEAMEGNPAAPTDIRAAFVEAEQRTSVWYGVLAGWIDEGNMTVTYSREGSDGATPPGPGDPDWRLVPEQPEPADMQAALGGTELEAAIDALQAAAGIVEPPATFSDEDAQALLTGG